MRSVDMAPYNFDARDGDAPVYRAPWYRHVGIRGRANLNSAYIDTAKFFDMSVAGRDKPVIDKEGLMKAVEDAIADEAGLELAYEGNRWEDLVRIALRRNDAAFLADKIAAKFDKEGNPGMAATIKARLINKENWYLPFKWK
jgi:starch-binding outer membrane protein, SusD/RagB family